MNFSWIAYYKDGTCLKQFEGKHENRYDEIRRKELSAFVLCEVTTGAAQVTVYFDRPTQRLIHRRRITSDLTVFHGSSTQGQLKPKSTIWIVGWQELVNGKNVQLLLFLYEDGTVSVMPRYRNHADFTQINIDLEDRLDGVREKKS